MSAPTIERVDLTKQPARLTCGHTETQHGTKTCVQVQMIEARVAYAGQLQRRRLALAFIGRKPAGWGLMP
jgi:hypothetical protein